MSLSLRSGLDNCSLGGRPDGGGPTGLLAWRQAFDLY